MKEIEERIIAGLIAGGLPAFKIYGQFIGDDTFSDPTCKKLYNRMEGFASGSKEFNLVTLGEEFKQDPVISIEYLLRVSELEFSESSIPANLQVLQDHQFRENTTRLASEQKLITANELSDALQTEIWKYQQGLPNTWNREHAFRRVLDSIEYDMEHGVEMTTGLIDLDRVIGGLYRKEVTFVGARPSHGKTALAVNVASHLINKGKKVLYIDLESGDEPMMERFICYRTGIPIMNIRRRLLTTNQLSQIIRAANELTSLPITINDQTGITIGKIYNQARQINADVIIVDYLNCQLSGKIQEEAELGSLMQGYQTISKDLNVPIWVLGQLNRKIEDRTDKIPRIADIRGSGKIEEFSTNIILLHWPFVYDTTKLPNENFLYVLKQKHGPVEPVKLHWDAPKNKFANALQGGNT